MTIGYRVTKTTVFRVSIYNALSMLTARYLPRPCLAESAVTGRRHYRQHGTSWLPTDSYMPHDWERQGK